MRTIVSVVVAVASLALAVATAGAQAIPSEKQVTLAIESQTLAKALDEWAEQTGFKLLSPSWDVAKGLVAPSLKGTFTAREALDLLLKGSPLTYEFGKGRTVTVRMRSSQVPSSQRDVPVESQRLAGESGAGRKSGRAGRSADERHALDADTLFEVVVTGTQIHGVKPEFAPLITYTAADMRNAAAPSLEKFMEKVPQNHTTISSTVPLSTRPFNPEPATGIDLRGLGIGTTLVLLNGRRLALAATGQTADLSMIPFGAVDRIEVLTDGASGIYGSNAVGGVVNVVLKDRFEGAQTEAGYGSVTEGGLEELHFDQTFGHDWDSGYGLVSYHYLDRNELDASERSFASAASPYTLSPPDRRHNFFVSAHQDGLADIEFFGDALFSRRDTSSLTTHSSGEVSNRVTTAERQYFADLGARRVIAGSFGAEVVASYALLKTQYSNHESFFGEPTEQSSHFEHAVYDVAGKLDGDLFEILGGAIKFSAGLGYSGEKYIETDLINSGTSAPLRIDRTTKYAFGELFVPLVSAGNDVPLVRRLELSLSARYTDYSDFGDQTSPRVGALWAPADFLTLRGTYSESFRAPSLVQLDPHSSNVIFAPTDFGLPDPFSSDGSSVVLVPQGIGNTRLDAERATTYTAGFDWKPQSLPGLVVSATYFEIHYRDRILAPFKGIEPLFEPEHYSDVTYLNPTAELIANVIAGSRNFFNQTPVDPTDPNALAGVVDVILDQRTRNLAVSTIDGVDFSLAARIGAVSFGTELTYIIDYDQQTTKHSSVVSAVDTVLQPAAFRGRAYLGVERGGWVAQLNVNYTKGYYNPFAAVPERVSSWTTFDLNVRYEFARTAGLLGGTSLSLSVQNVFDRDPPFVSVAAGGATINDPVGFDPSNADPIGRFIAFQATKAW